MKTKSAKNKGRRLQKRIVEDILRVFPNLSLDDVRSNPMSVSGADILLSAQAKACIPFTIEAKNQERVNIWEAIRQSEKEAEKQNLYPMVVVSKNRVKEPYAIIPFYVLLLLLKTYFKSNNTRT